MSSGLTITRPYTLQSQLKLLVFGHAEAGKTTLAATAEDDPRSAPTLFVDFEGGTLSIRDRTELDVFRVEDYARDMPQLHRQLQAWQTEGSFPYRTLVLDSLTAWSEMAMQNVLTMPGKRAVDGNPEWADWNTWTNRMDSLLKFFTKLPINVIMTSLEEEEGNMVGVMLKGKKLPARINAYFDIVARLQAELIREPGTRSTHIERRLYLAGDSRVRLRDRTNVLGRLPTELENPTISALLDRIEQGARVARAGKEQPVTE